jgi:hypothetical protein
LNNTQKIITKNYKKLVRVTVTVQSMVPHGPRDGPIRSDPVHGSTRFGFGWRENWPTVEPDRGRARIWPRSVRDGLDRTVHFKTLVLESGWVGGMKSESREIFFENLAETIKDCINVKEKVLQLTSFCLKENLKSKI